MKRDEAWLELLRECCKEHGSGKCAGEIVRDPVADGYASYMVFSLRPLILIHIPLYDAYQSCWAHRWTAKDVSTMVERERAIRKIFS